MNQWVVVYSAENNDKGSQGQETLQCGKAKAFYNRDGRFDKDQLFFSDDHRLIIIDGVILNLSELKKQHQKDDLFAVINRIGSRYFSSFIGPFCGVDYDAVSDTILAYGNQTGDAPVFYYAGEQFFVVSNDLNSIVSVLKENNITYTLNEQAARYLLSFGYMIDNSTWINEIKRLEPGKYISFTGNTLHIHSYFQLSFEPIPISEQEAIDKVNMEFRKAVKRCFDKDLEYGYPMHLADISGGLDSRLVNYVAKDLGFDCIVNMSYSQSDSDEHRFAEMISKQLENMLVFEQLDEASFFYDIDKMVEWEYGLAPYFGITGGLKLLSTLNMNAFGLEHTGQLGDCILGTYLDEEIPINQPVKRYSELLDIQIPQEILQRYNTTEAFLIMTRGFLGMLATHLERRHYTYVVSPFLDIEFLQTCMHIPVEMRQYHKLYWKLLDEKYPEAASLPSTRERQQEGIERVLRKIRQKAESGLRRIIYCFGFRKSKQNPNNMNPIQYWYETNKKLRAFIKSYHDDNLRYAEPYPGILHDLELLFCSEKAMDKLLSISAIATIKLYFG